VDADSRRPSSVKKTVVEELSGLSVSNANGWWLEGVIAGKVCVLDFLPGGGEISSASGGVGIYFIQFFNYRNVKTHFHMRKTQSSKMYVKSDLYKYESAMAAYSLYSGKLKSVHDLLDCLISEHGTTKYLIIQDISSTTVCLCLASPVASIYDLPGVVKSFFPRVRHSTLESRAFSVAGPTV